MSPLDSKDFESIYAAIEQRVSKQGEYLLLSTVTKVDPLNFLVWVPECGDQAIPLVGYGRNVRYYDTQLGNPSAVTAAPTITVVNQLDYAEDLTDTTVSATTAGTANTCVTGNAINLDGSTSVFIEFYCPYALGPSVNASTMTFCLYDNGALVSPTIWAQTAQSQAVAYRIGVPIFAQRRYVPSAASHTFSVRAFVNGGSGTVYGASGKILRVYREIVIASASAPATTVTVPTTVTEKQGKSEIAMPKVGDTVLLGLERGTRRLPRCIGVLQGKNFISTSLDEA